MFDANVVSEGLGQAETAGARASMRGSPDGLGGVGEYYSVPHPMQHPAGPVRGVGAHVVPEQDESPDPRQWQQPQPQYSATAGELEFIEPDDTSQGAAMRSGGFTLLFVALATGIGYAVRGGLGAAGGLLLSGGLANGYRAQKWWDSAEPSERHESIVSSVFALGEVASGAYVIYKAFQEPKR